MYIRSIHLINEKTDKIELAISHNLPNELIKQFTFGDLHQVVHLKSPLYFSDGNEQSDVIESISGGQIPVMAGGEVTGVLSFIMGYPRIVPIEHRDTIELLTSQLGNTLSESIRGDGSPS